jgi:hypothetical protein
VPRGEPAQLGDGVVDSCPRRLALAEENRLSAPAEPIRVDAVERLDRTKPGHVDRPNEEHYPETAEDETDDEQDEHLLP